jgi:hypothetical protein
MPENRIMSDLNKERLYCLMHYDKETTPIEDYIFKGIIRIPENNLGGEERE